MIISLFQDDVDAEKEKVMEYLSKIFRVTLPAIISAQDTSMRDSGDKSN